jgi:hypothetical protein
MSYYKKIGCALGAEELRVLEIGWDACGVENYGGDCATAFFCNGSQQFDFDLSAAKLIEKSEGKRRAVNENAQYINIRRACHWYVSDNKAPIKYSVHQSV